MFFFKSLGLFYPGHCFLAMSLLVHFIETKWFPVLLRMFFLTRITPTPGPLPMHSSPFSNTLPLSCLYSVVGVSFLVCSFVPSLVPHCVPFSSSLRDYPVPLPPPDSLHPTPPPQVSSMLQQIAWFSSFLELQCFHGVQQHLASLVWSQASGLSLYLG